MARIVASALLLVVLLLVSCGRLGSSGGFPVPGPTPSITPSPIGSPIPDVHGDDVLPTTGPVVTG